MTEVQGLAEFHRRWGAIPDIVRAAAKEALEEQADRIVREMRAVVPVRSGALRQSINWTWGDAPAGSMTVGKVRGQDYGSMRITIYAGGKRAFWARFIEFGTTKMPAHPFFYPVWRTRRRSVKSRVSRAISKAIRSA